MMAAGPLVRLPTFGCVSIQAGAHRSWATRTGSPVPRKACERLEPDAWKQARPVCAVRRSVVSLAQPGRTWRNVLGSNGLPNAERPMGTRACQQSSELPESVDGDALLDPHDMGKAILLEVQSPDGDCAHPSVERLKPMSRSASA